MDEFIEWNNHYVFFILLIVGIYFPYVFIFDINNVFENETEANKVLCKLIVMFLMAPFLLASFNHFRSAFGV